MTRLTKTELHTPLGTMIAVTDAHYVHLLQFTDMPKLAQHMRRLEQRLHMPIVAGTTPLAVQLAQELEQYFAGTLHNFTVPIKTSGTPFQLRTWQTLQTIPYGTTASYAQLAQMIYHPTAHRAVANANGTNDIIIIIPCHRIIRHGGQLGGYGAGVERKQWLIAHEAALRISAR